MVDKDSADGAIGAPSAPAAPGADSGPGASSAPGTPAAGASQDANPAAPAPKRARRGVIVAGVIVAVVLVAGIGAWVWHEQPSFCNAICHTPMDGYLETYEATPGQPATDKWGNPVADAAGMLSAVHRTNSSDADCLTCHQPVMSEQIIDFM